MDDIVRLNHADHFVEVSLVGDTDMGGNIVVGEIIVRS